jgi:hypothetical protein
MRTLGVKEMSKAITENMLGARARLLQILAPGATVVTIVRHVSKSGMSRAIDAYTYVTDETTGRVSLLWLSPLVAKATGLKFSDTHEALWVSGCGMDMGYHVVNCLSRALSDPEAPAPFKLQHERL